MSKQTRAFDKLTQLAEPKEFKNQFVKIGEGASPTSCAQNAMVIAKYITNQPMQDFSMVGLKAMMPGGMSGNLTNYITNRLNDPILIYLNLNFIGNEGKGGGDHHFCAFGLDQNNVVAAMGWQNLYTFEDWFHENECGIYKTKNFLEHLRGIESGSTKSVIDLCAYLGVVGYGPHKGQGIITTLTNDIGAFKPKIVGCYYLDLP